MKGMGNSSHDDTGTTGSSTRASPNNPENQGPAHAGFSIEALQAIANESAPLSQRQDFAPEMIRQFVVDLIAANNAALLADFQVLSDQNDELRARVEELEVLLGISEAFSSQENVEGRK
jgi:hypothetical protein